MNMDETKLYSWFPGPKVENADMLERLILEALRDRTEHQLRFADG